MTRFTVLICLLVTLVCTLTVLADEPYPVTTEPVMMPRITLPLIIKEEIAYTPEVTPTCTQEPAPTLTPTSTITSTVIPTVENPRVEISEPIWGLTKYDWTGVISDEVEPLGFVTVTNLTNEKIRLKNAVAHLMNEEGEEYATITSTHWYSSSVPPAQYLPVGNGIPIDILEHGRNVPAIFRDNTISQLPAEITVTVDWKPTSDRVTHLEISNMHPEIYVDRWGIQHHEMCFDVDVPFSTRYDWAYIEYWTQPDGTVVCSGHWDLNVDWETQCVSYLAKWEDDPLPPGIGSLKIRAWAAVLPDDIF